MFRIATILLIVFAVLVAASTVASARTWYIKPDGTGDAPTIQAGINSAAKGDTVLVAPGIYAGVGNKNLDSGGKDLVVRSEAGPDATTIDCQGTGRGFSFGSGESPAAVVEGFRIQHGNVDYGGAIYIDGSCPSIKNNTLADNTCSQCGGAIYCNESDGPCSPVKPTISNNTFLSNTAAVEGGGISCHNGAIPIVTGNTFRENNAVYGGGIFCNSHESVSSNSFVRNHASANGGAIYCEWSSAEITHNSLYGNTAGGYGGAIFYERSHATITNNFFSGNCAHWGGAIASSTWDRPPGPLSGPSISDNFFVENSGTYGGGGIICCGPSDNTVINDNMFWRNAGGGSGGAILCWNGALLSVARNTLSENRAGSGGGIYCSATNPRIENTIIAFSSQGQAIACEAGASPSLGCCDIYGNTGGDWVGCIAGQNTLNGNFSLNPHFCLRQDGDYCISYSSPCAPGHHPYGYNCGLIGAGGVGCDHPTEVEYTTWGRIKSMFR